MSNEMKIIIGLVLVGTLFSCTSLDPNYNDKKIEAYMNNVENEEQAIFDKYSNVDTISGNPNSIITYVKENYGRIAYWEVTAREKALIDGRVTTRTTDPSKFPSAYDIIGFSKIYPRSTIDKSYSDYIINVDIYYGFAMPHGISFTEIYYIYTYSIIEKTTGECLATNKRTIGIIKYKNQEKVFNDNWS